MIDYVYKFDEGKNVTVTAEFSDYLDYVADLIERADKAIKYIEKETEVRDKKPIEGSWLYNLLKVKEILKGE